MSTLVLESADGYQLWHEPRPGVVLIRFEGWVSNALWNRGSEMMESSLARAGRLFIVTDGEHAHGAETTVTDSWGGFMRKHREGIGASFILARSPLLRMAVQISAMTSGYTISLHRDRATFESTISRDLPGIDLSVIRTRQSRRT